MSFIESTSCIMMSSESIREGAMKQRCFRVLCLTLVAILSFCTGFSLADEVKIIRASRMLDVVSGKLKTPAVVVVENDRIVSVGEENLPSNAEVIDLGDVTLLPGLMDMHVHLTSELEGPFALFRVVRWMPADFALRGARNARRTLMAGFTTVRDVGAGAFTNVSLSRAVERGDIPGPWIIPSGHAIGITGGHCDTTGFAPGILERSPETGVVDGPEQALRAVRYQIKHGARVIKICATAGVLSFEERVGAQQLTDEEMRVIVEEAHRHGIPVAAHAHGTEGIIAAVRAGVDSIEHGSMLNDEAIALMKAKGTFLVPTTYLADTMNLSILPPQIRKKAETILPLAKESVRRAIRAGVKIAYGTDAGVYPHGDNGKEFAVLVKRGMSPLAAIQAATIHAAELARLKDRGRIEPGMKADLIAVAGNPLEDITVMEKPVFVMRGGEVFKKP